jgi:putative colanic acid biosynthesis glycosyltransferase
MVQCDVSIVTTTLNCARSIPKLLSSVRELKKALAPDLSIEFVVSDGESGDGTTEMLRQASDVIDKLVVKKDKSAPEGLNNAMRETSGHRVVVLNADDWPEIDGWNAAKAVLKKRDDTVLFGSVFYHHSNGKKVLRLSKPEALRKNMTVWHVAMFVPMDCLAELGMLSTAYKYAPDYDLALRIFIAGYPFKVIEYPTCNVAAGGVTDIHWVKALGEVKRVKETVGGRGAIRNTSEYLKALCLHGLSKAAHRVGLGRVVEMAKGRRLLSE